jgi:hypothetical protein
MLATAVCIVDSDEHHPAQLTVGTVRDVVTIEAAWTPYNALPVYLRFTRLETWRLVWTLIRATLPRWP